MSDIEKQLGKIEWIQFGYGGYNDAMFGLCVGLSGIIVSNGSKWGVSDFKGTWPEWDEYSSWSKEDQRKIFADVYEKVIDLCKKAKAKNINELKGKPVEVTFENRGLKSWRILEEVL